jgi:hypothetical protein
MKTTRYPLIALLFAFFPLITFAQFARVQVIHNAADPAAASVDVWLSVNGVPGSTPLVDDFAFRAATPFIDAPAGVPLQIGIAPGNSTTVADTIANFNVQLTAGETYVVMANGVLNPASFDANPDGKSTGFTLWINAMAREAANNSNEVDFFVVHGASDAPTVDVRVQGTTTPVVDNAAYGDITGYLSLPGAAYPLEITTSDGSTVVATYNVDLTGLNGGAAAVFASGFLSPSTNQNGDAFSLCFALADGTTGCFSTLVAVDEASFGQNFSVFPNPAQDQAQLRLELSQSADLTIQVADYQGRVLRSEAVGMVSGQFSYDLSTQDLANGLYMVSVYANGDRITQRLAIAR